MTTSDREPPHEPNGHELDDAWRETLRRDPSVVVRRRKTREPFVPAIRVARPVDVLELIGRHDDEADAPEATRRRRA